MIGFMGPARFVGFVGRGGRADIDPAFIVTHNGEPITHNGIVVTVGANIDPASLVTHQGEAVTVGGKIVTTGEDGNA